MSVATMALLMFSNAANIVGNWILIFGHMGFCPMGPLGAAWARVVARGVAAVVGVALLAWSHPAIRLSAGGWRPRGRFMWKVMSAGMPVALQWTVRMAAIGLVLLVIAPFGSVEKAAFGVGTRLDTLALFAGLGWGAACAALVSHGIGRGKFNVVRLIARDSAVLNVTMMSIAGALYAWCAPSLVKLFSLRGDVPVEPAVLDAGVLYLRISALSYPGLALCVVWAHAMNGVGSVKTPLLLDTVGLLVIQVPLAWYLSSTSMGVAGAWWALVASHSLLALVYYLVFRTRGWERKKRR
jgi:Na+-driven multidrug efflux pump